MQTPLGKCIEKLPNELQEIIFAYMLQNIETPFKFKPSDYTKKGLKRKDHETGCFLRCPFFEKNGRFTDSIINEQARNYLIAFYGATLGMFPINLICIQRRFLEKKDLSEYPSIEHVIIYNESTFYNDYNSETKERHHPNCLHSNLMEHSFKSSKISNVKIACYIPKDEENLPWYKEVQKSCKTEINALFPNMISIQTNSHGLLLAKENLKCLDISLFIKSYSEKKKFFFPNLTILILTNNKHKHNIRQEFLFEVPRLKYILLQNISELAISKASETLDFIFLLKSCLKNTWSKRLKPIQLCNMDYNLESKIKGAFSFQKCKYLKVDNVNFFLNSNSSNLEKNFEHLETLHIKNMFSQIIKILPELNNLQIFFGPSVNAELSEMFNKSRNLRHFFTFNSSRKTLQCLYENCPNIETIGTRIEMESFESLDDPGPALIIPPYKKLKTLILLTIEPFYTSDVMISGLESLKACENIILIGEIEVNNESSISATIKKISAREPDHHLCFIKTCKRMYKKIQSEWIKKENKKNNCMFTYPPTVVEARKIRNLYLQSTAIKNK